MNFKLGPHDTLVQKSELWDFLLDGSGESLEKEMCEFMIASNGIGLAANQIGIAKRVFVMGSRNIPGFPEPFAVFNPRITEASTEIVLDQEGCLAILDCF